jgi:hypothetical protein
MERSKWVHVVKMGLILNGEIKGEGDDDVKRERERERESKGVSLAEHQILMIIKQWHCF